MLNSLDPDQALSSVGPDLEPNRLQKLRVNEDFVISGLTFAVEAVKSLVLTLAVMDKYLTVERAVQLSRLEQDFQVSVCRV